jgi:antitoxin ParD1/3/4
MTVTLTPEQKKFVTDRVKNEGYSSPEQVIAEGLRLIQAKEEYERRLAELRRELQIGVDQIKRGEVLDGREVFDEILKKNQNRPRPQA